MKVVKFILLLGLLCGCADMKIIEDLGFIHGMGLDIEDEGEYEEGRKLLVTVSIPQIEEDAEKDRELLTTVARSDKEAMLNISRQSNRKLVSGQLRTFFTVCL
uniref:Ger(x)C family spore germination protein n=1 Tax=Evansella halocellulosilytica TaxID=2011013 RepID=UPI000BB801AA|nr:hypothetical protein [Evansella halocellulosilytica]